MKFTNEMENLLLSNEDKSKTFKLITDNIKKDSEKEPKIEVSVILDLLSLTSVQSDKEFSLKLLTMVICTGETNDSILEQLFHLSTENTGLFDSYENMELLHRLSKYVRNNSCNFEKVKMKKIIYIYEALYAHNLHMFREDIVNLYRCLDSNLPSNKLNEDVIHAKLAIAAYSSGEHNYIENAQTIVSIFKLIKQANLKWLKSMVYYYCGILSGSTKKANSFLVNSWDWKFYGSCCGEWFRLSKECGFWLSDIMIEYL